MYGTIDEVMKAYTKGFIGLEDANRMLKELGSPVKIDPYKNVITANEYKETTSDGTAKGTTGYGFMNHGVGNPEKMYVKDGKFEYDTGFDADHLVVLYIAGKKFKVVNDHIEDM